MYKSLLTKLNALWNYLGSNPLLTDFFAKSYGKIVLTPSKSWISQLHQFNALKTGTINVIFNELGLPPLDATDLTFLDEFTTVMQHFATAQDILNNDGSVLGTLLPTILSLKYRLEAIRGLQYCEPLKVLAIRGLEKRFEILDLKSNQSTEFLIATISHPAFKMSCIPADVHSRARDIFIAACTPYPTDVTVLSFDENVKKRDSFFSVLKSSANTASTTTNEVLRYLSDDCEDLNMLMKYPSVREVFLKYNTCLSSSAVVNQFYEDIVRLLKSRNHDISDERFEEFLLLKINKNYCKYATCTVRTS